MPAVVLFDLDGTLSDSAPGILTALRHALAVNGVPPVDETTERVLLGGSFYETLPPLIGGVDRLAGVIAAYRKRYAAGAMFDTAVYAGVPETLAALRAGGVRLAVATSKSEFFAVPIVERLGLAEYFEIVGGDDLDGSRGTKALVVAHVLHQLGDPDPRSVLMVGDRKYDVHGARAHDIDCIGAGWGYALPGELEAAGAVTICARPSDLLAECGLAAA